MYHYFRLNLDAKYLPSHTIESYVVHYISKALRLKATIIQKCPKWEARVKCNKDKMKGYFIWQPGVGKLPTVNQHVTQNEPNKSFKNMQIVRYFNPSLLMSLHPLLKPFIIDFSWTSNFIHQSQNFSSRLLSCGYSF